MKEEILFAVSNDNRKIHHTTTNWKLLKRNLNEGKHIIWSKIHMM